MEKLFAEGSPRELEFYRKLQEFHKTGQAQTQELHELIDRWENGVGMGRHYVRRQLTKLRREAGSVTNRKGKLSEPPTRIKRVLF